VSVNAQDDVAFSETPIIGGEEDQGDPSIVALYAREPDAEAGSLCTAEIISPTVVLTAAHCVHPELVGAKAQFWVLTAWNLMDSEHPSPRLAVKEVHYHEGFSKANLLNGNDIAVAILAEPTDLKPLAINRQSIASSLVGDDVRIVGYGLNKHFGGKGAGTKRQATLPLDGVDDKFVLTGTWGKGICSGDSGGPVLAKVDGVEQIIGVNSFGFLYCFGNSRSTRVDSYLDFVDRFL
jgi:secreted trypsin-like serine protease